MQTPPPTATGTEKIISILVVDNHGLIRDTVSGMLEREQDMCVLGIAENADEAIRKVLELKPELVLMDIDMPGISCFDAIQIIRSRVPSTKFILVTAFANDEYLDQALRVKVNGFVLKSEGLGALAEAVRRVASGQMHFSSEVMGRLVVKGEEVILENPPKSRLSTVSPRERELLRL